MKKFYLLFLPFFLLCADYGALKEYIVTEYQKRYPSLLINDVVVTPISHDKENVIPPFMIANDMFKSKSGIISALGTHKTRLLFRYDINGTIIVWKTTTAVRKGENLGNVSRQESLSFDTFSFPPATLAEGNYNASRFMAANRVISINDIEIKPLIAKGEWLDVFITEGALELSFSAQALEEGRIGSTLRLRTKEGKLYTGFVTPTKKVIVK